ncbi:TldD/PmbA family protein [candidate division TA06 bacterium]|nr:TldD/PmbA family protein [candidate division TA06 bacterium]
MIGEDRFLEIAYRVFHLSKADQTEILLMGEESNLTRFANSQIHQNVSQTNTQFSIKAVVGKRVGISGTNRLDEKSLKRTVERAIEIAQFQPENTDFISLPQHQEIRELPLYVKETHRFSPEERAEGVKRIVEEAQAKGFKAYGAYTTGVSEVGVANSLGIFDYALGTDAFLNTIIIADSGSGYAQGAGRDVRKIHVEKVSQSALLKAERSQNPVEVEPGEYEVVLEEHAVVTFLNFLGYMGLGALAFQERRSFMNEKLGKKITGENITLWDDGLDLRGFAFPFDFEGVAKKKVLLIDQGIAKGVVYDSLTAGKESRKSTGHSTGSTVWGPFPMNLFMKGGNSTIEEMVKSTKRGIYVTRFHYTNVVEPMETIITGMTRNGTFLIENGEITRPLKNLRFTQSILKALSHVTHISKQPKLVGEGVGYGSRFATGTVAPSIKCEKFNFTGVTEF